MKVQASIALVTGANRGLGLAIVKALQARGAKKIYAGVRDPASFDLPGVIPVKLDVTRPEDIAVAAAELGDVNLLVNNAGIAEVGTFLAPDAIEATRHVFETNFYGPVALSQAFAPTLARNGGGAIVNVLSVVSWVGSTILAPYAATKAALWSFTNSLRLEVAEQGTQVLGLHVGFMDTDLTRGFDTEKISPEDVASLTLDGLEAGQEEVLADEVTRAVKHGLSAEPGIYLSALQR